VPAAALADCGIHLGVPASCSSRTAGLVGHLAEEVDDPIGIPLWLEVDLRRRLRLTGADSPTNPLAERYSRDNESVSCVRECH
jgi:hypothetical protein